MNSYFHFMIIMLPFFINIYIFSVFISHSSSLMQLKFIFQAALPMILLNSLTNKLMMDIGSRLGAVLYGASMFINN